MEKNSDYQNSQLTYLPNIGTVLEKQLNEVGIFTYEDLRQLGQSMRGFKYNKLTVRLVFTNFLRWKVQF